MTSAPFSLDRFAADQSHAENLQLQDELEVALKRITKERKEVYDLETSNNKLMSFLIRFMSQHEQYTKQVRELADGGTMPDKERDTLYTMHANMKEFQDYYHRERGSINTFYLFKDAEQCRKRKASERDAVERYSRTEPGGLFEWDREIDGDAIMRTKSQRQKSMGDMKKHPRVAVAELRARYFASDPNGAVLMLPENGLTLQSEIQAMETAAREAAGCMISSSLKRAHELASMSEEHASEQYEQAASRPREE